MVTLPKRFCSQLQYTNSFRGGPVARNRIQISQLSRTSNRHVVDFRTSSATCLAANTPTHYIPKCLSSTFLSPFVTSPASRTFSRPHLPLRVLTVTSGKRNRRPTSNKKQNIFKLSSTKLTSPIAGLIIGAGVVAVLIAATSGVIIAGAVTTLVSLPIILALSAAVIPLLAVSSFALAPLLPIIGAFGLFSVASGNFVGTLFDKLLCAIMCVNFLGAAFSAYGRARARARQVADEPDEDTNPLALDFDSPIGQSEEAGGARYLSLLPSFVSVVPQINGLAWFLTLSDAWDFLPLPRRASLIKNAILYSVPGFFWALKGVFLSGFTVFTKTPSLGGSAWWVAVVLGAVHLQFERAKLEEEAEAAEVALEVKGDMIAKKKGGLQKRKITAAERQSLEWNRELEEFDAMLGKKPSATLPESPRDWSSGDVVTWLKQQGLARYGAAFLEHDVDGKVLVELTGSELSQELGVTSLGDRKRMGVAIRDLKDLGV